jgi:glutamyl-tRNA reductase
LHRLFQRAFRVAKQVRSTTGITRGSVSVGSVAVDLAEKIFGRFESRKVLLLGAGDASERTARALVKRGVRDIRIANRSWERAEALAALICGRAVPFDEWERHLRQVDILVSSTGAQQPIVTRESLAPLVRDRLDRPLFVIDIAVPRDVAPEVNEMEGVFLYDIDSLQSIAQQSIALRREQMEAGEQIIDEHVNDFSGWFTATRERLISGTSLGISEG